MTNENEKKAALHESLAFLVESANINDGKLTIDEINNAIKDVLDDPSAYKLVYDYLLENKIQIEGYAKEEPIIHSVTEAVSEDDDEKESSFASSHAAGTSDTEEHTSEKEKMFLHMYMDEMDTIDEISAEAELQLLEDFLADMTNKDLLSSLTTANLTLVTTLAEEFRHQGVSHNDLIQEGNLGLMEGIMTYENVLELDTFHNHLANCIRNALKDVIAENNASTRISLHTADRANEIDRASVALSKELDRTPTLEELAKYLSLPEDEVERVMKMSLNALTIDHSDIEQ